MNAIGDESYVQLTTFTRDGCSKPAPVWIAPLGDGRVGFTTGVDSWKARRIRRTPRVELRVCDRAGNISADVDVFIGQATIGTAEEESLVRAAIAAKYGWQFRLIEGIGALARLFGKAALVSNAAVVIRLSPADAPPGS